MAELYCQNIVADESGLKLIVLACYTYKHIKIVVGSANLYILQSYSYKSISIMEEASKHLFSSSVQLLGHKSEVYATRFSPSGDFLASAGNDHQILIWDIFDPQCKNTLALKAHSNSILELCWTKDSSVLLSCSADKTFSSWDVGIGAHIRRYKGHEGIVNSVDASQTGSETVVTAGDDFTVKLWDSRDKAPKIGRAHV